MAVRTEPGRPTAGEARFELRGDTLLLHVVARGVALDGGDLRLAPAPVALDGRTLRWEAENRGGGRVVTTARLTDDGRVAGEARLVGGRPAPAGFAEPRVAVVLTRAAVAPPPAGVVGPRR